MALVIAPVRITTKVHHSTLSTKRLFYHTIGKIKRNAIDVDLLAKEVHLAAKNTLGADVRGLSSALGFSIAMVCGLRGWAR